MKIGIVTSALVAGGAQRVIVQLVQRWVEEENEIVLVLLEKKEKFFSVPKEVKIYEIGRKSNNSLFDKVIRYSKVRKILKSENVDVILSLPEEIGIYVALANIGINIPIVVSERNNPWVMPNVKITRFLRRIAYHQVNGLIFQTANAASFFSGKIQAKGRVLANPLDLNRVPDPFRGSRKKIIVSAGRLEAQKNFKLLIDAFILFYSNHKDYKLCIFGEGNEREQLESYIGINKLENVISLPGKCTTLLDEIKDAALFVLSSDYEGVPNALIEAMAVGIPVVSTDCEPGGAAELITNGHNGLIVPIKDAHKLSEAIEFMISNPDKAQRMADNGLLIKNRMDSRIVADQWLSFLKEKSKSGH